MSFDAFIIPAAPQPPANGVNRSPGGEPATLNLDRAAQSADQKKSFLATLNRVSERKSRSHERSTTGESQTAKTARQNTESADPASAAGIADQNVVQDRTDPSEATGSVTQTPLVRERPAIGLIHEYLFNMLFADDGALMSEGQSDSNGESAHAVLNQFMGRFHSEEQPLFAGQVGIGFFEQLQSDISPEAHNLSFFKQLLNRASVHPFAADASGPHADNPHFQFWRSLTTTPAEGINLGGQMEGSAPRVDTLINFLLQRYHNPSPVSGPEAASVEANGKQTTSNMEVFNGNENLLLHKMSGTVQPADARTSEMNPSASPEKDGHLLAGAPKVPNADTLLGPRLHTSGEQSPTSKPQLVSTAAEPGVNSNLAAESMAAKPSEDAVQLKTTALQNDIPSADQTGSKVIHIDGEAKDSSFFASQESLPEHLTKLEPAGRSAEGTQRSLAYQTMDQIVQKAVLLNNNGQNAVQIDLKPDFLGHIRMQIVTESQQVAVRIVAELPFVKDMLENNLNQLKAELQAQGLKVDELEVSVAHDSRADDDLYQKAAEARRNRAAKNNRLSADATAEEQGDRQPVRGHGLTDSVIDFFA